jgi:hypothetical protein
MRCVFIFQKRGEKSKQLKLTYLSNYLNKMKQNVKMIGDAIIPKKIQIMVKKVYL